jgi:predicted O-linked N-acetylglucosamine transferase (SPINDLY family)
LATGSITFGSYNNLSKLSAGVRELWAKVLLAVPGSRLLLKTNSLADAIAKEELLNDFVAQGIRPERIVLEAHSKSYFDHMARYGDIDIALDPFPWNGVTTTCDTLWMGVPVISLAGSWSIARMGVSILTCIGLDELLAQDHDDYVALAVKLAGDPVRLNTLRVEMRQRMLASPLLNAQRFARNIEDAYRALWTQRCDQSISEQKVE